jgi:hypothetical protein
MTNLGFAEVWDDAERYLEIEHIGKALSRR